MLGKAVILSVLDLVGKNPFTCLPCDFNEISIKDIAAKLLQAE
jgi:hypothetical protein